MAHNLTEAQTFDANVPVPDPGDNRTAASVIQFAQPLANRSEYLRLHTLGADARGVSIPLTIGVPDKLSAATPMWIIAGGAPNATPLVWQQNAVTGVGEVWFDVGLIVPPLVTVTDVKAYIQGGAGHGALPATKPKLWFSEYNYITNGLGAAVSETSQSDNPANVGAYEANHVLGGTGLSPNVLIDQQRRYIVTVQGEAGANSVAGLSLLGIKISWSVP